MSRSERLLRLLQLLHQHRYPISGQQLAAQLGISLRTLYRDIRSLQQQGADIRGEAGIGYQLKPGFVLPPLMFDAAEIEALVLGMRWVEKHTDTELSTAAQQALAKISTVLPTTWRQTLLHTTLLVAEHHPLTPQHDVHLRTLRQAIRHQHKVHLSYQDQHGQLSQRVVWPFAVGFFNQAHVLVAWCETRQDYRHFRLDRIQNLLDSGNPYPQHRQSLLKSWAAQQNIPLPSC